MLKKPKYKINKNLCRDEQIGIATKVELEPGLIKVSNGLGLYMILIVYITLIGAYFLLTYITRSIVNTLLARIF